MHFSLQENDVFSRIRTVLEKVNIVKNGAKHNLGLCLRADSSLRSGTSSLSPELWCTSTSGPFLQCTLPGLSQVTSGFTIFSWKF